MKTPGLDRSRLPGLVLLLLVLAPVAAYTLTFIWSDDYWWYVTSGQAILRAHGIPGQEPFLYPLAGRELWVTHSWLWQALIAVLHGIAGNQGPILLATLLALGTVALVHTAGRVDRPGVVNALFALVAVWAISYRISLKADMVGIFLLAVYIRLFERWLAGRARWTTGILLLLQVLWVNLHGSYLVGVLVALAYAVGRRLENRGSGRPAAGRGRGKEAPKPAPPLWLPLAMLAATVISPGFGTHPAEWTMLALRSIVPGAPAGAGMSSLVEWQPILSPHTLPEFRWKYFICLGLGALSFGLTRRPWSVSRALLFLGLAWLALTGRRFLGTFGVTAAMAALVNLSRPAASLETRRGASSALQRALHGAAYGVVGLFALAVLAGVLVSRPGFEGGRPGGSPVTLNPLCTCPGAASFIAEEQLPGPIFNDMYLGGYLGYRLYPKQRLFIDNRNLDFSFLNTYTRATQSPQAWAALDRQYGFRTVILGNLTPNLQEKAMILRRLLRDSPEWRLAYVDPMAVVFTRREGGGGSGTAPRVGAGGPETRPADTARLEPRIGGGATPFLKCRTVPFEPLLLTLGQLLVPMDSFVLFHHYLRVLDDLNLQPEAMRIIAAAEARCPGDRRLPPYRQYFEKRLARGRRP